MYSPTSCRASDELNAPFPGTDVTCDVVTPPLGAVMVMSRGQAIAGVIAPTSDAVCPTYALSGEATRNREVAILFTLARANSAAAEPATGSNLDTALTAIVSSMSSPSGTVTLAKHQQNWSAATTAVSATTLVSPD